MITLKQISVALKPHGFEIADRPGREVVLEKTVPYEGLHTIIRIYTAVLKDGTTRPPGQDALRIVLARKAGDGSASGSSERIRVFKALTPIARDPGWDCQLLKRLRAITA